MKAFHESVQTFLCRKIATNGSGDCLYDFHNYSKNFLLSGQGKIWYDACIRCVS